MNEELIKETQKLVTFESYPGKEKEVSDYVEILMKKLGFRDVFRDEYGSVFGFIGPKKDSTSILFDSHTDVMPVRGNWIHPPFGGQISDGKLYGRGSTDMKGSLCSSIFAAVDAQKNNSLKKQYVVSASVLEEEIEGIALGKVMDRVKPENVVICEPSKLKIKLGHKGRVEFLLNVNGKTFHSAFPNKGVNTIHLAGKAITALENMKFTNSHEMGEGVLTPTGVVTNSNTSMAPSETVIRFDRRTVPGDTDELVEKEIMDIVNKIDPNAFSLKIEKSKTITYTGEEIMTAQLHTDQLNFNAITKTFSAEASELGWKPGLIPMVVALTSARTGDVESFALDFIEEDGSLKFEACRSDLRQRGIKIHVFND